MEILKILNEEYRVLKGKVYTHNGRTVIKEKAVADQISKNHPYTLADVLDVIPGWVQSYKALEKAKSEQQVEMRIQNPVKSLTLEDWNLLYFFRWAVSNNGTKQILYFRDNHDHQVYTMIEAEDKLFVALTSNRDAYQRADAQYLETLNKGYKDNKRVGLLVWDEETKGKGGEDEALIYPHYTLKEYLEKTVKYILGDVNYQIPQPEIITNDPKVPTFVHTDLNFLNQAVGTTTMWDEWVDLRLPDAEDQKVFKAYIYSIFDSRNTARQALWLKDNGQTGKSTIMNVLVTYMRAGATSLNDQGGTKSQFIGSQLYGKRMIVVPDCKNTSLIRTGIIHQVLGGDTIPIEIKGQTPFTAKVHCKMIVGANYNPEIDVTQVHEKSRVLLLVLRGNEQIADKSLVSKFTQGVSSHEIEGKLLAELPAFIAKCADAYNELCPTHNNICLNSDYSDKMFACIATEDIEVFEHLAHEHFTFEPEATMGKAVLQKLFRVLYGSGAKAYVYSEFKRYLSTVVPGFQEGRFEIEGSIRHAIKGIKIKVDTIMSMPGVTEEPMLMNLIVQQKDD